MSECVAYSSQKSIFFMRCWRQKNHGALHSLWPLHWWKEPLGCPQSKPSSIALHERLVVHGSKKIGWDGLTGPLARFFLIWPLCFDKREWTRHCRLENSCQTLLVSSIILFQNFKLQSAEQVFNCPWTCFVHDILLQEKLFTETLWSQKSLISPRV